MIGKIYEIIYTVPYVVEIRGWLIWIELHRN